ncbi:MAG: hypothetical protein BJ554DRAFT_3518, partial [Olpidium bornovanus]
PLPFPLPSTFFYPPQPSATKRTRSPARGHRPTDAPLPSTRSRYRPDEPEELGKISPVTPQVELAKELFENGPRAGVFPRSSSSMAAGSSAGDHPSAGQRPGILLVVVFGRCTHPVARALPWASEIIIAQSAAITVADVILLVILDVVIAAGEAEVVVGTLQLYFDAAALPGGAPGEIGGPPRRALAASRRQRAAARAAVDARRTQRRLLVLGAVVVVVVVVSRIAAAGAFVVVVVDLLRFRLVVFAALLVLFAVQVDALASVAVVALAEPAVPREAAFFLRLSSDSSDPPKPAFMEFRFRLPAAGDAAAGDVAANFVSCQTNTVKNSRQPGSSHTRQCLPLGRCLDRMNGWSPPVPPGCGTSSPRSSRSSSSRSLFCIFLSESSVSYSARSARQPARWAMAQKTARRSNGRFRLAQNRTGRRSCLPQTCPVLVGCVRQVAVPGR